MLYWMRTEGRRADHHLEGRRQEIHSRVEEVITRAGLLVAGVDPDAPDQETRRENRVGGVAIKPAKVKSAGVGSLATGIETERTRKVAGSTKSDETEMAVYMKSRRSHTLAKTSPTPVSIRLATQKKGTRND